MDKKDSYKQGRNTGIWVGLIVLIIGRFLASIFLLSMICWLIGLALVLFGSWNWAKYKGRSGWWALWGLLAPIGFIPLALLQDKYVEEK